MKPIGLPAGLITATLLGLAACSDGAEQQQVSRPDSPAVAAVTPLPAATIDSLREVYPVLGAEPAQEPQPRPGADPDDIPARVRNTLPARVLAQVTGEATFYANKFEGRRTASGIPFRQNQMVAAHRAYPFGTLLRVTNLRNDRSVNVRVVDRGPFGGRAKARSTILDLSQRAARELDYISAGRAPIRVEVLEWGRGLPRG